MRQDHLDLLEYLVQQDHAVPQDQQDNLALQDLPDRTEVLDQEDHRDHPDKACLVPQDILDHKDNEDLLVHLVHMVLLDLQDLKVSKVLLALLVYKVHLVLAVMCVTRRMNVQRIMEAAVTDVMIFTTVSIVDVNQDIHWSILNNPAQEAILAVSMLLT